MSLASQDYRFVASSDLSGQHLLPFDGSPVLDRFAVLRDVITRRCGDEAGALFAEPRLQRANGATTARIDWYAATDRPVVRWSALDPVGQQRLRARFAAVLATLRPLVFDPAIGPLLATALNLDSHDSLALSGDQPLLLDWGVLPSEVLEPAARARHNAAIFVGLTDIRPVLDAQEWASAYGQSADPGAASTTTSVPSLPAAPWPGRWRAPVIASAIAGATLLLSYVPGVLAFQGPRGLGADHAVAEGLVRGLRDRLDRLGTALGLDCAALSIEAPRLVPTIPVHLGDSTARPKMVDTAGPATSPAIGPATPPAAALTPADAREQDELVGRLERGVVLIIAGDKMGSGFFVKPDLVVTNRHVIDGVSQVLVAGKQVGMVVGTVVSSGNEEPLHDFALLRVPPQAGASPLVLAIPRRPMEPVVSAGFPGLYMSTDPSFQRLKNGDARAAGELEPVLQAGVVNHLQHYAEDGLTLVVHSADIAPGNSGGPLVDDCGRVLGVNTFDRSSMNGTSSIRARYALGADGLRRFLTTAGVDLELREDACQPTSTAAATPAAPTPAVASPSAPAAADPRPRGR